MVKGWALGLNSDFSNSLPPDVEQCALILCDLCAYLLYKESNTDSSICMACRQAKKVIHAQTLTPCLG